MVMSEFVDKTKVFLREINASTAKEIIIKNHYSHKWTTCSVALGVFYKQKVESNFFDDESEKLIGCLVYGNPVGRSAAGSISDKLTIDQIYELTRLFIHDGYGKNIESLCIGLSFDWIRKNRPQIKALLSYADNEAGHTGIIYQSTNWIYQGNSSVGFMPNYSVSLTGPEEGYKWIHSRTVFARYGSHNAEHVKSKVRQTFWRKKESNKHRYVYILPKGKERNVLIKSLKHPALSYPKKHEHKDEIVKYEWSEKDESSSTKTDFFSV